MFERIQQQAGFVELTEMHFDEATSLFLAGKLDAREVCPSNSNRACSDNYKKSEITLTCVHWRHTTLARSSDRWSFSFRDYFPPDRRSHAVFLRCTRSLTSSRCRAVITTSCSGTSSFLSTSWSSSSDPVTSTNHRCLSLLHRMFMCNANGAVL